MKTNTRMATGFTLVELLVVIAIIVTLAGVATPVLLGQKKKGDHAKAVQNAKQVGYALFNFENDFGRYPDDNTEDDLDTDAIVSAATGSNLYLSQLVAGGYVDQEAPFYCKTAFTIEPDNDMSDANNLLASGEVGFSYVMRSSGTGLNSSVNSAVPLLCAPSDGTGAGTFDRNVYNKRSVVLRIDMSVTDPRINDDGDITLRGGLGLLETGAGSVWDDSNITAPELEEPAADTGGSDTTTTTGTT